MLKRWSFLLLAGALVVAACERHTPSAPVAADPTRNMPPPPADTPDAHGLISPAGHLRPRAWLYLNGERLAPISRLTERNPDTHQVEKGVVFEYAGREDYRPQWAIVQNFRVREDGN